MTKPKTKMYKASNTEERHEHGVFGGPTSRHDIDGRTRRAKLFDRTVTALIADLGGDDRVSMAQRVLARGCAGLSLALQDTQERLVRGEAVDLAGLGSSVSALKRALEVLGLRDKAHRVGEPVVDLREYLAQHDDGNSE